MNNVSITIPIERIGKLTHNWEDAVGELKRYYLPAVLEKYNGNKAEAARRLGLQRNTLRKYLDEVRTNCKICKISIDSRLIFCNSCCDEYNIKQKEL